MKFQNVSVRVIRWSLIVIALLMTIITRANEAAIMNASPDGTLQTVLSIVAIAMIVIAMIMYMLEQRKLRAERAKLLQQKFASVKQVNKDDSSE